MSHNLGLGSTLMLVSFIALGVPMQIACDRVSTCSRVDAVASMDPSLRNAFQGKEPAWGRDAIVCNVGQYQVVGPASGDDDTILVWKDGKAVFVAVSGGTGLFKDGVPLVNLIRTESPAQSSMLSYTVHDESSGSRTTVMDRDLDGQADVRMRGGKGQEMTIDVWADDGWRPLVRKDGKSGFNRDGQFVPLALPETLHTGEGQ